VFCALVKQSEVTAHSKMKSKKVTAGEVLIRIKRDKDYYGTTIYAGQNKIVQTSNYPCALIKDRNIQVREQQNHRRNIKYLTRGRHRASLKRKAGEVLRHIRNRVP